MRFLQRRAAEEIMRSRDAIMAVIDIGVSGIDVGGKTDPMTVHRCALVIPGTEGTDDIVGIICMSRAERDVFAVHQSFRFETLIRVFAVMEEIPGA